MSKISWWKSLRAQSFVIVLCFGGLLASIFIFYTLPEQARWVNDGLSKASQRSLQQLSASITSPLLTRQYAQLYENIDSQLAIHTNWQRLKIVDAQTQLQLYPLETWISSKMQGDRVIVQPVIFLGKTLANIELVVNFSAEIEESSKLHYTLIYSQFFILVLIFMAVIWLADQRITTPLKRLETAFKRLAKDDFKCHIEQHHKNEVGNVINAFNDMATEVAKNHHKLNTLRIKAESASKAKSDFMASMSHELRTPLNAILGLAQLYSYDKSANDIQKSNARSIYQAGEHLLLLIDDVLDLTAIESGNMQLACDYVSLESLLSECLELVAELVKENQIKIHSDDIKTNKNVYLYVDQRRFKQVMLNLLSNAIKYNKPHGDIYISCEVNENKQCKIAVKDSGCGFSAEAHSRLFKPFDRLGAETSNIAGTGIGLVITKQLVEHMQGEISAQSELGVGSIFTLEFPCSEPQQQIEIAVNEPNSCIEPSSKPLNLKVLVAEDQVTNQLVLKQQLNALGVEPVLVSDGKQAWNVLQSQHFDMLLTDIQMPNLNGLELAQRIRSHPEFSSLVVIAITANIVQKNIDDCKQAGMNGFITKPIELNKLNALLFEHSIGIKARIEPENVLLEESKANISESGEPKFNEFEQLDLQLLMAMLGEEPAIHCMVFDAYLQTVSEQVRLIFTYKDESNYKELAFQAHGLKSSSKSVAAIKLANICEKIETDAEQNTCEQATFEQFEVCLNEVLAQLQSYCSRYQHA